MSGSSSDDYKRFYRHYNDLRSKDAAISGKAKKDRTARIDEARSRIAKGDIVQPPARDESSVYRRDAVKNKITAPSSKAERLHIVLVDNSGSNRKIAEHLKRSTGYLLTTLGALDPGSQLACIFFSDHCDGALLMQEVDYVSPDEAGDVIMHSSIRHVASADGGDAPEAIECALWRACDLDFGGVQSTDRHLYLVTDQLAHDMGSKEDSGCPLGRFWKDSLKRVAKTYGSFEVIGCGADTYIGERQRQFLADDRKAYDFVDLSAIPTHEHRTGITGNALLFFIARNRGLQTVETFLMSLYEKWLTEPIFGANTDL
ncbi:MAG: hypothetical protein AAB692_01670, partial [Patescibacteria group bacterium]